MKKVLIVTYYWPPSGGAGVQRWLKFVKYLRQYGWEPVVYTPENPEAPSVDESLMADVPNGLEIIKQPIWEPYSAYKAFIGQKQSKKINAGFLSENKKPKLTEKIAVWLRGNLFIPDARMFWVKPSVKFLSTYLKENKVDAIITTGPPHSMHLIGLKLKKETNIPWVADFRDPWTTIDFYHELMLTPLANRKHHRLENAVVKTTDCLLTIGYTMGEEFKQMGAKRVEVITNGYDEEDILPNPAVIAGNKFTISHIGSINKARNPEMLWKVLSELVNSNSEIKNHLKIRFVGKVDFSVTESIKGFGLEKYLEVTEYLPHKESIEAMCQSSVLLLLINRTKNAAGILTGKFFEYLAAKRPILAIGPTNGDIARIIAETNCGQIVDFDDSNSLQLAIEKLFEDYKLGISHSKAYNVETSMSRKLIQKSENQIMEVASGNNFKKFSEEKYSRKSLTKNLAEILNNLIKE